jgi:flagellar biogenesis protein FliO
MRFAARSIGSMLLALAAGGIAAAAAAGDDLAYTPPQAPPPLDAGPMVLRLFGMTAFVLLLCAAILWSVRLVRRPRLAGLNDPDRLRSLGEVALASRCSMHLLQAGGNQVLIAVDAGGIKACHLVDESFAAALTGAGVPSRGVRQGNGPSVAEVMSLLAASKAA